MSFLRRMTLLGLVGCGRVEYDYHRDERIDVFRQTRQRAVDLLLVIDNSCSMEGEQDHLAQSFEVLIAALETGDTDWRVAATTSEPALPQFRGRLAGGTDEIVVLAASGGELDRVAYDDTTWPMHPGRVFQRCDPSRPPDDPAGWAAVDAAEATPGAPNPCAPAGPGGVDRGPRPPLGGELRVSEFLPWAPDTRACEWIELENTSADTLDLDGVVLKDDGRNRASLPGALQLGPGERLVVGRTRDRDPSCEVAVDVGLDGSFSFAGPVRWIDRDTPNAAEIFSEHVAVGTGAFGLEMGMENALVTLSDPDNGEDAGSFLRADADLALLFFSDEDDLSPASVDRYADRFRQTKGDAGYRQPGRVRFGAAVGLGETEETAGDCAENEVVLAERYLALMERTGGLSWSICDDLSRVADEAGVTFSEQILALALSAIPALDTLVVAEYASEADSSFLGTMERDRDFRLELRDDGAVWMIFPEDRVSPGAVVTVTYEVLPDTATLDLGNAP